MTISYYVLLAFLLIAYGLGSSHAPYTRTGSKVKSRANALRD
jgi:hypothetical protein